MNALLAFICFKLVHGLAVIRSTRALDVFRKYALGPILPQLLHMTSNSEQLVNFLKQSKLPFDRIYNNSCGKYIGRDRLDQLVSWIVEDDRLKEYIMSPECLSGLYLYLDYGDWDVIDRTYPLSEMMNELPPLWSDETLVTALKELYTQDRMVQSCTWLCNPISNTLILQTSIAGWTGKSDAWRIFHHSCFMTFNRLDYVRKNDRIERIIDWLTKELPLEKVYKNIYSEEHLMRWSIHLIHILRSLSNLYDLYGTPAAKPIFYYLKALRKYCKRIYPLVTEVIMGGTAFFMADLKPKIDKSLPNFDAVIRVAMRGLTGSLQQQARWFLDTTELYQWSYGNFFDDPLVREDTIRSIERTPTIVQKHWTALNLAMPVKLEFLDFHICWEVETNKSLQRYLLSRIDSKATNALVQKVFTCVPEEALVKEARWRFTHYTGYRKYLRRLNGFKKRTLNITTFLSDYFKKFEDLFKQYKDEKDIESIPEQFMFVLAVADLFELASGSQIISSLTYDLISASKSWLLMDDY